MQDKYKDKIVRSDVRVCPEFVFGSGDKAVHIARYEADCLDTLIIEQTDELPVGMPTTNSEGRKINAVVAFRFTRSASVGVVIAQLQRIQEELQAEEMCGRPTLKG